MSDFELMGYFKEYWVNNKFVGYTLCEKDREVTGYYGRKDEVTETEVVLTNKKKIKAGTQVVTSIYPLNGKSLHADIKVQ